MAVGILLIWVKREPKYFCKRDWTGQIRLNCFRKFAARRKRRHSDISSVGPCECAELVSTACIAAGVLTPLANVLYVNGLSSGDWKLFSATVVYLLSAWVLHHSARWLLEGLDKWMQIFAFYVLPVILALGGWAYAAHARRQIQRRHKRSDEQHRTAAS